MMQAGLKNFRVTDTFATARHSPSSSSASYSRKFPSALAATNTTSISRRWHYSYKYVCS